MTAACGDGGVGGEHVLHLPREDVEPARDDHVLLAVDDRVEAVVVLRAMSPVCSQPNLNASAVCSGFFQ